MVQRVHLIQQESGVTERAIQILADDPESPVENQVWMIASSRRIKARLNGVTVILAEGDPVPFVVPATTIDSSKSKIFTKSISANTSFSVSNLLNGSTIRFFVTNTSGSNITVSFSDSHTFASGQNGVVNAGKVKEFVILKIDNQNLITTIAYN